jgi:hypothetical protein
MRPSLPKELSSAISQVFQTTIRSLSIFQIDDTHLIRRLDSTIPIHTESILIPEWTLPEQIDFVMSEEWVLHQILYGWI